MGFKRSELRAELNKIVRDTINHLWTEDEKNLALDYAIDHLWPEISLRKVVNDITLAANTYIYKSTTAADLTELGFSIIELEVTNAPYRRLEKVFQRPDLSLTGGWGVHVEPDIVSANVGKKLKLWYHARHPRLASDTAAIDLPTSVPVVMYAAVLLCTILLPEKEEAKLAALVRLIPEWQRAWLEAKRQHRTPSLPCLVKIGR